MTSVALIIRLLRDRNSLVPMFVGGTIPNDDIVELKGLGVTEIFASWAPTMRIGDFVCEAVAS